MIKINLEFENLEEFDEILKGVSAGLALLGEDTYARILGCASSSSVKQKYTEEEQTEYFQKAKVFYETLTNIYDNENNDCLKEN